MHQYFFEHSYLLLSIIHLQCQHTKARQGHFLYAQDVRAMGIGSGGQGGRAPPPWIFKHGTNIADRS